jgi:hypothetical protein
MKREVAYRNVQDLIGHNSGEVRFNRHEIFMYLTTIGDITI